MLEAERLAEGNAVHRLLLAHLVAGLLSVALATTIPVTTTADELDLVPNGKCSLREAIISANENRDVGGCTGIGTYGTDTVTLPAGVYRLTRTFGVLDQDFGDLDIIGPLTIVGAGASASVIDGNAAGRVVTVHDTPVTLKKLTIRNGETEYKGGGIYSSGALSLENVVVSGNRAWSCGGILSTNHVSYDGVYFTTSGALTMTRSAVTGNRSDNGGGGLCLESPATIEASTVSGNWAGSGVSGAGYGGGAVVRTQAAATVRVSNSTLSGNGSSYGGGGLSTFSGSLSNKVTLILSSVTLADNRSSSGGGLHSTLAASAVRAENTLIAANLGVEANGPDCAGTFDSRGNNLVGNGSGCSGFGGSSDQVGTAAQPLVPELGALANSGGPTQTHALLAGSPAIDRGGNCGTTDQRGEARPKDGDGDGFAFCDIGAYEAPAVAPQADLTLAIARDRSRIVAGASFSYVLSVTNSGPATASAVSVSLTLQDFALRDSPGCARASPSAAVTCTLGNLARGATRTVSVFVTAPTVLGSYVVLGAVTSSTQDPARSNNDARNITRVVAASADVSLSLSSAPNPATVGQPFTYTVSVANAGPDEAERVWLSLTLPASLSLVSAPSCTPAGGMLSCAAGTVPLTGKTLRVTVRPTAAAAVLAVATVGSDTADDNSANNSASVLTAVDPAPAADLTLALAAPQSVQVGAAFSLTLVASNSGPTPAAGVLLSATLPSEARFVSAPGCTQVSGTVRCSLGSLAVGAERAVTLNLRAPDAPGTLRHRAVLSSDTPDLSPSNNEAEALTAVAADPPPPGADLSLLKQGPGEAGRGSSLRYSLTVVNHGPETATNIVLTDTLPPGVSFESAVDGCVHDALTVRCALSAMLPGSSASVALTVRLEGATGVLVNRASVSSANDPNPDNDAATFQTTVQDEAQAADLFLAKGASRSVVTPGAVLSYSLNVANLGPSAAAGVALSDTLPEGADLVTLPPACTRSARVVRCALGTLAASETRRLTLEVRAPMTLGPFVNRAEVTSDTLDPNAANNRAEVQAVVEAVEAGEDPTPPTLSAALGPKSPGDQSIALGRVPVPALQVALTAGPDEALTLESFTVAVAASGRVTSGTLGLTLYADADGDGRVGPGDVLVARGTVSASGEVVLGAAPPQVLAPQTSEHWLIALDDESGPAAWRFVPIGVLGLLALRRKRWLPMLLLMLVSCAQPGRAPPEAQSYAITLKAVAASGEASSQPAALSGLPLTGGRLTVTRQ